MEWKKCRFPMGLRQAFKRRIQRPDCCQLRERRYFYVLENGYESNTTVPACCCCAPLMHPCCTIDAVLKTYFDRGVFDQTSCCWWLGCHAGAPHFVQGSRKYICMCIDCPSCFNNCADGCHFESFCGSRLRVSPASRVVYCCCHSKSNYCTNVCGLCGLKDGEPLCVLPFLQCLGDGEAEATALALTVARAKWCTRTGNV